MALSRENFQQTQLSIVDLPVENVMTLEGRVASWQKLVDTFKNAHPEHQFTSSPDPRPAGWIYQELSGVGNAKTINIRMGETGLSFSLQSPMIFYTEGQAKTDQRYKVRFGDDQTMQSELLPDDPEVFFANAHLVLERFLLSEEGNEEKPSTRRPSKKGEETPVEIPSQQDQEEEEEKEEEKPYYSDNPLDPDAHLHLRPGRVEESPKVA